MNIDEITTQQEDDLPLGVIVGRSHHPDVQILERDVAARHAKIFRDGDGVYIADFTHYSVTYVNGERIKLSERHLLREGDLLKLGRHAEVRVVKLPKEVEGTMVLKILDRQGARNEEVRLPMSFRPENVLGVSEKRTNKD